MPKLAKRSRATRGFNGQFSALKKPASAPEYSSNGVASFIDVQADNADESEASDDLESGESVSTNSEADWREIPLPLT